VIVASQYSITGTSASTLAASIEQGIRTGALPAGRALPTVRALAAELDKSPATVAAAYRTLRLRGLVVPRGRHGTRVSERPALPVPLAKALPAHVRNLAEGNPDPRLLPVLAGPLSAAARRVRLYGEPAHAKSLVAVARALFREDGVPAEDVAVVGGALDGVERVLLAHLRPGDPVAVEDPGYTAVFDLLAALGLPVLPVAQDASGAKPADLRAALRRGARAVVLTPRAQNPTGSAWDKARVIELTRVLDGHPEVLVLEDDHAGSVAGTPARTTCAGARTHWAVVRSVSKSLGPDLRLAVLAGDAETVARVSGRQAVGAGWVSHILQETVAALWTDSRVTRAQGAAARMYTQRRDGLLRALAAHGIPAEGASGLNVWVPVAEEAATMAHLAAHGYAVRAGERYRIHSGPGVRVTVSTLSQREAVALAAVWAQIVRPGQRTRSA
jgi:DNA-binding transcriptional MocR family regulator